MKTHKLHRSTLNATRLSGRSDGVRLVAVFLGDFTIVPRVRVDDYAHCAGFLCGYSIISWIEFIRDRMVSRKAMMRRRGHGFGKEMVVWPTCQDEGKLTERVGRNGIVVGGNCDGGD